MVSGNNAAQRGLDAATDMASGASLTPSGRTTASSSSARAAGQSAKSGKSARVAVSPGRSRGATNTEAASWPSGVSPAGSKIHWTL